MFFICTGTVGTLVPATLCLCTNMLVVPHWYCYLYVLVLWVLLVYSYQPLHVSVPICYCYCCLYVLVLWVLLVHWYERLCLCAYTLLVPHWYCCLYVLVLWVLLVHWYKPLYVSVLICYWYCTGTALYMYWYCGYCWYIGTSHSVSVPICYWHCTGTAVYMYWYCGYCWYIGTSHSMSLCLYVTGATLVLLFICTGTVGTGGTQVPATLFLCINMLLVLHWYCSLYVLVLLVHWYQPLYGSLSICYWYHTGTVLYMYWYCGYCWYTGTSHSMSLYQYITGTALVLLFICTGTVGTVGTLVPATLCLCTNMLLVLHWYCCLYVVVLWVLLVHWYE